MVHSDKPIEPNPKTGKPAKHRRHLIHKWVVKQTGPQIVSHAKGSKPRFEWTYEECNGCPGWRKCDSKGKVFQKGEKQ